MANGQPINSVALEDELREDVALHNTSSFSNGGSEAVREMLPNATPVSEVEQTVLDLVTQVDKTVAYNKDKQRNIENTRHLDSSLYDVLEIVEGIMVKVDEDIIQQSENKLCGLQTSEECIDTDENKRGDKRTYREALQDDAIDVPTLEATKDSLYVMSLVEAELKAVELEANNNQETKPKLVDYDDNSSESSDEVSSDSDSTSSEDIPVKERKNIEKFDTEEEKMNSGPPKTKDEILLKDLPPEPEVNIALPDDVEIVHVGLVMSIVESMVVVKSLPGMPALDFDTLLFLENRTCLGKVFETFGPVQSPFYSVRFNTPEDITKMDIKQGKTVFYAPEGFDCTKLVFVSHLKKLKGSDASWQHDQEPPPEVVEYSDDEEEKQAKVQKKQERKSNKPASKGQTDSKEKAAPAPQNSPRHKVSSRNWLGRGRGNPLLNNDQHQQPLPGLPHQFHRGPPPSFRGAPPSFRGAPLHSMPYPPPFFPASLPQGIRPPPFHQGPFNHPPPLPLHPDAYYAPPFPGGPPTWNHARPPYRGPPAVFPPFENRPPAP